MNPKEKFKWFAQNIRKSLGLRKKWTKYVNKDTEAIPRH